MIMNYYEKNPITSLIILVNVMMAIVIMITGGFNNLINLIEWGALYPPFITRNDEWFRLLTAMFLHGSLLHVFFNMYVLFYLGALLERILGKGIFLLFYLATGLIASFVVYRLGDPSVVTVGASGAIFGIIGALFIMTYLKPYYFNPYFVRSIRSLTFINVALTFIIPQVSFYGHIGGLLSGFLLYFILVKPKLEI
jgi:rhomboid protease GluP